MTTTHTEQFWVAGDDWMINALLLRDDGTPFDLTGPPPIMWCLMDAKFRRVIDQDDVGVSITDATAGTCKIFIPAEKTSPLAGGRYSDFIRIIDGGVTSTLSYGLIYVTANPWVQPEVLATKAKTMTTQQRVYTKPRLVA